MGEGCVLSFSDWDGCETATPLTSCHGNPTPDFKKAKLLFKRLLSKYGIKKPIKHTQLFLPRGFPCSGLSSCPTVDSFPPSSCKEIPPVHSKGAQPWVFFGRNDAKLKLQYFGHLMRRVDSLKKTLMLGGIGGRRRRG